MGTISAIIFAILAVAKEYLSGIRRKAAEADLAWSLANDRGARIDQLKAQLKQKEETIRVLEAQLVDHLSTDDIATELNKLHSH